MTRPDALEATDMFDTTDELESTFEILIGTWYCVGDNSVGACFPGDRSNNFFNLEEMLDTADRLEEPFVTPDFWDERDVFDATGTVVAVVWYRLGLLAHGVSTVVPSAGMVNRFFTLDDRFEPADLLELADFVEAADKLESPRVASTASLCSSSPAALSRLDPSNIPFTLDVMDFTLILEAERDRLETEREILLLIELWSSCPKEDDSARDCSDLRASNLFFLIMFITDKNITVMPTANKTPEKAVNVRCALEWYAFDLDAVDGLEYCVLTP